MTLDEIGVVILREDVPGIYILPRAGGQQLVHCPGSKRSRGTTVTSMVKPMVPFRPVSLRLSSFSV